MRRMVSFATTVLMTGCFCLSPAQAADIDGANGRASAPPGPVLAQGTSPSGQTGMTPSEKGTQSRLERAGYTQVRDVKSGPEGITAKAVKDGKEVAVVVDSTGNIKESPARR